MAMLKVKITCVLTIVCCVFTTARADENEYLTVVHSDDLESYWIQKRQARPVVSHTKTTKGGCVAVGFIIDSNGKTKNLRVISSFPDNATDKTWLDVYKKTRYKPADSNKNREAVYTVKISATFKMPENKHSFSSDQWETIRKILDFCKQDANEYLVQLTDRSAPKN